MDIGVAQDRKGEFKPQLVKKKQTSLSGDIEEKILSMYAKGMTTRDIDAHRVCPEFCVNLLNKIK